MGHQARAAAFPGISSSEAAGGAPVDVVGGAAMESAAGSMRSVVSMLPDDESMLQSESDYSKSELSSVATRVYAPSNDDSRYGIGIPPGRLGRMGSWGATDAQEVMKRVSCGVQKGVETRWCLI